MDWFNIRWTLLRPARLTIKFLAWLVSKVPGTTNCERAEMGLIPCSRCIGHAVTGCPDALALRQP